MVRPRLSKRFIALFTIRNMTRLVFGSARIYSALHRARDQSRPNPRGGTTFSSSDRFGEMFAPSCGFKEGGLPIWKL